MIPTTFTYEELRVSPYFLPSFFGRVHTSPAGHVIGDPRDPNDVRFVAHSLCDDTFTRCHSLSGAIGLLELTAARFDLRKIEHD